MVRYDRYARIRALTFGRHGVILASMRARASSHTCENIAMPDMIAGACEINFRNHRGNPTRVRPPPAPSSQ